jgi:hypothetical protein
LSADLFTIRVQNELLRFHEAIDLLKSRNLSPSIESFQRLVEGLKNSGLPLTHAQDTGNGIRFAHIEAPLLQKDPCQFTYKELEIIHKARLALEMFLIDCHLTPDDDLTLRVTTHTAGEEH